ncbi:MAG: flavodoxin [Acholeplasmatales bacterium]|jgi:flavodoxin short chain|nr:flavodoxin [Acholeplasmatales bacterium]
MAKILLVYWSGTGNTSLMAEKISQGVKNKSGDITVVQVSDVVAEDVKKYDSFLFGCPSMGVEELEEVDFLPFYESIESELVGKKIGLFGSYGWGTGEWMENWESRVIANGSILFEKGVRVLSTPGPDEQEDCLLFGERFYQFVS